MALDFSVLVGLSPVEKISKAKTERVKSNEEIKGDFRITKGGTIVFSEQLKEELRTGNKFVDIFNGKKMIWTDSREVPFMFFTSVPNTEDKASLQIKWTEETKEETKFKPAFINKYFKPMATELYGIDWEAQSYVDFTLLTANAIESRIANIPRTSSKTRKEVTKRRENVVLIPFVPSSMLEAPKVDTQMEIPFENDVVVA